MGPQGMLHQGLCRLPLTVGTFESYPAAFPAMLVSYLCSITDPQLKHIFTGSFFLIVHVDFFLLCNEVEVGIYSLWSWCATRLILVPDL